MALPDLIEIIPLPACVEAEITVPGSKSITNRALLLAALSRGTTRLTGALWSEDTQVMTDCLRKLGIKVEVTPDPTELSNRTIEIQGLGGAVPAGGSLEMPLDLFVGNAGTAARFLAALVCLGSGVYRVYGVPRMHERPQAALFEALRTLGYRVEAPNDRLPALIVGGGVRPGSCSVSIEESSQFASALLLCARTGGWQIEVRGENAEESPYVAMTSELIETFSARPQHSNRAFEFQIEPDASSASYFWAAAWLLADTAKRGDFLRQSPVRIAKWQQMSNWQIDTQFPACLPLKSELSRQRDLGDSIMTAIVLAPLGDKPVRFTDLSRLRVQECERVAALRTELEKCGARVRESGDMLEVFPSELHGATVESYNDHRIAMCFATLGLKVPGIKIKNPACVKKTFPNFFQKLAAPPPVGLGATVFDPAEVTPLDPSELLAE